MEARCSECDSFLSNPKNVTHCLTEHDSMKFGMNCGSCNAMNYVHVEVKQIDRV